MIQAINPDTQLHAFRTYAGLPPGADAPPACGAILTPAYGQLRKTDRCPTCERLMAEQRQKELN
jgi:hypothetical protein